MGVVILFKRYAEVLARMEELGPRMGVLSNRSRQELHSLLEEQAWLSETLVKQARSVLQDIDQSVENLFDWLIEMSDLIERAGGPGGTSEDILGLEPVVVEAGKLREQLRNLTGRSGVITTGTKVTREVKPQLKARLEAAPTGSVNQGAQVPVAKPVPLLPVEPLPGKTRKKKEKAKALGDRVKGGVDKKNNRAKSGAGYQAPRELVTSLAEKLAPVKNFYQEQRDDL